MISISHNVDSFGGPGYHANTKRFLSGNSFISTGVRMSEEEIWKPYPKDPRYKVSNMGKVKGIKGNIMRLQKHTQGYMQVEIAKRTEKVHRMVLETFIGPCPDKMETCHNNGIVSDNHLSNLRWDTRSNNHLDRLKHGTMPIGKAHHLSKLKEDDIPTIKQTYVGGENIASIARKYDVAPSAIRCVLNSTTWSHADKTQIHFMKYRGERRANSKLKNSDIPTIRKRADSGELHWHIAKDYNVSYRTISDIARRKLWKHIQEEDE